MRLARVVDLGDERAAGPEPGLGERHVHGPDGEHGRDRRTVGAGGGVAHDQDRLSVGGRGQRLGGDPSERDPQTGGTSMHAPCRVQPASRAPLPQEEALELLERRRLRVVDQERRPRSEQHAERHHRALPEMIHGGVRHLREALAQVVEDRAPVTAERGDRRVVAHRERGLLPVRRGGAEHHGQVLPRIAVLDLTRQQLVLGHGLDARHLRQPGDPTLLGPRRPRPLLRDSPDRVVVEPAPARIDDDHLARTDLPPPDPGIRQVDDPRLGGAHHEPVVRRPSTATDADRCGRAPRRPRSRR